MTQPQQPSVEELKECPFCGGAAEEGTEYATYQYDQGPLGGTETCGSWVFTFGCKPCGIKRYSREAWNSRTSPSPAEVMDDCEHSIYKTMCPICHDKTISPAEVSSEGLPYCYGEDDCSTQCMSNCTYVKPCGSEPPEKAHEVAAKYWREKADGYLSEINQLRQALSQQSKKD